MKNPNHKIAKNWGERCAYSGKRDGYPSIWDMQGVPHWAVWACVVIALIGGMA